MSDSDLKQAVKILKIPHFKGIFSRDELRGQKPKHKECAIINQDLLTSPAGGTHWCAFKKSGKFVNYYDSIGNLRPPPEVVNYLKDCYITYNREGDQKLGTINCGHLCLRFLENNQTWPQPSP